jgi:hypothetical protein
MVDVLRNEISVHIAVFFYDLISGCLLLSKLKFLVF